MEAHHTVVLHYAMAAVAAIAAIAAMAAMPMVRKIEEHFFISTFQ